MKPKLKAALTAAAGLLTLAGLCLWAWKAGWFSLFTDEARLRAAVEQAGPWGPAVFFLLQLAQVIAAPIPGNVTTLAGGAVFGLWKSFLLSTAAVVVGSAAAFALVRRFGRPLARRFVKEETMDKYESLLKGRTGPLLALMFLFPFFPDDALCFLAGLTPISFGRFLLLTVLTRPWGLLVSALIGAGAVHLPWWAMALLAAAGIVLGVLAVKYGPAAEESMVQWFRRHIRHE